MKKVKIVCRALIIDSQHRVLFVKKNKSDFWSLPGGKLDIDDLSLQAGLAREMQEELGVEAIIKKIRFVQELHKNNTRYIELIWQVELMNNSVYTRENIFEKSNHELMDIQWIKKNDFHNVNIKPEFLKDSI